MGAIFGLLRHDGRPIDAMTRQRAARVAARYGRDGPHLWQGDDVLLGRAVNLVRPRAASEATGLPDDLRHLHGVASARLDNRAELLAGFDLAADVPDLTLILLAYATWGETCPEHLRGDFAFAIWDAASARLFCARDRAGMRPFHYRQDRDSFAFASAPPILAALTEVAMELDESVWAAHFARRPVAPEASHWRGVSRLPPACSLTVEDGRVRQRRYWTPQARHPGCRTEAEWAAAGRDVLGAAVASQGADSPVLGLMLSGGLDSSFILGLAAAQRDTASIRAVASVLPVGHAGPERDERAQQALLRRHFPGLVLAEVVQDDGDPIGADAWADPWRSLGRPANLFYPMDLSLSAALAKLGARVAYSGFWGDGGLSYSGKGWSTAMLGRGEWRAALATARQLATRHDRSTARELLAEARFRLPKPFHRGATHDPAAFLAPRLRNRLPSLSPGRAYGTPWRALPEILSAGFSTLEEQTLAAASEGIDLVCPYLAPEMVEFILAVPPELYVAGGWRRGLARQAMQGLVPDGIRWRTDKQPYLPLFSHGIREHWPAYQRELTASLADPDTRDHLERHLDLGRLQALLREAPPPGSGFGREREVLHAAMAISALRFLTWARTGLGCATK